MAVATPSADAATKPRRPGKVWPRRVPAGPGGGPDGLAVFRRLIAEAPKHLQANGLLLLEIGSTQENAVRELLGAQGHLEVIAAHRDGQKLPRVIEARKSA